MRKTKIILDADVIIHFSKGGYLNILPKIFSNYDFVVLDVTYTEIKGNVRNQLDNQILYLKNILLLPFNPNFEMQKEYANLIIKLGKGESASMIYCKYNKDVIGSSNLKDIVDYCKQYNITYLTTLDFLYYAIRKQIMTVEEANKFIEDVRYKDSKLPDQDMTKYQCHISIL
jgi:hypothetical protein